jgi:hypothetical protein
VAYLYPPTVLDIGQIYQIAVQAWYLILTLLASIHSSTGMLFRLAITQAVLAEAELVK